jgi:hypothetical protein
MKNGTVCLLASFILLICTMASGQITSLSQAHPGEVIVALPFKVVATISPEAKEQNDIHDEVVTLLQSTNFDELDGFADKLRLSRECWGSGSWKLGDFYSGLVPSDQIPDSLWEERIASLHDWIAAKPKSITARVALAYVLTEYAWKARGKDCAVKVSDDGWHLFFARLNDASEVLNDAKQLPEKCPVYWSVQMRDALGLQTARPAFDAMFNEATNYDSHYKMYYYRRAMYLLPRWYGNDGEWESDLATSADRIGGEEGDELYAQVVWCVHETASSKNIFEENQLSWPRVSRGFDDIEKRFPDSLAAISEHARLAVLARDRSTARKCFDLIGGKLDLTIWKSESRFVHFAHWAYN